MSAISDDKIDWNLHYATEEKGKKGFDDADPYAAFDYLLSSVTLPSHPKVLELGCGSAKWFPLWDKLGASYWGIDFSEEAIKMAKEHYPKANVIQGRVEDVLPALHPNDFDVVFTHTFLQHTSLKTKMSIFNALPEVVHNGSVLVIQEKNDLDSDTTFTKDRWIWFVEKYRFHYLTSTKAFDPRNGMVFIYRQTSKKALPTYNVL